MAFIGDVREFHRKFNLIISEAPRHLVARKLKERIEFMQEELDEFKVAAERQHLAGMADALIDLAYVTLGTAVMLGLPWLPLWFDVHRANMAKERGATHRGHPVDVRKPAGWEPPKTAEILADYGYCELIHSKEEHHVADPTF